MVGADTIIRLIGSTLALFVLVFVAGVGYMLADPIYNDVIDPQEMTDLGWGAPQDVVMLFMGLAMIGIVIVIILWWIVAPARQDVRQEAGPPF